MNLHSHNISITLLLILLLSISSNCLHLKQKQPQQLIRLKQQQQLLKSSVNEILQSSQQLRVQVQQSKTFQQKVSILQNSIKEQQQIIFNLKNELIYPFNQSQTACNQLTQTQKSKLLIQIDNSRKRVNELKNIISKFNQNIIQIQQVNNDIQKQLILLQKMEDILKVQCKKNMSPTIFQSNLNAKNWILGPQSMKDIQNQYTKRAIIFHNITNCAIETPFYNPRQQQCIQCIQPNPVFDMFLKQCSKCQIQQIYDPLKHICKPLPHYTNFTKLSNWNLFGGNLPIIDTKLTPCTDDKPYFNGIVCVKCQLPKYWNVSANLCKKCQNQYLFDLNTKNCEKIKKNQLTILQNTKWVTDNITKVVQERVKILKNNQTTKNYQYCPNNTPYYDGTTCINCEYFNIDTKRCVIPGNNIQYNSNMHRFITPQASKQTNIMTLLKYITNKPLTDTSIPNCNLTHPFYDTISCIYCMFPFDIYNIDQKKCISCNDDQIYDQNIHTCKKRNIIYVSDNFSRLLATQTVSVKSYKDMILKKINDNTDSIIMPCQKGQYSNFTNCFICQDNEYFNIQLLKCTICDGIFNQTTQTCKQKVYIFTNLKAPNLTDLQKPIEQQTKRINQFLSTHKTSYICSIDKPYAIDDKQCGICPQLFSYTTKKCTQCPQYFVYLASQRKCTQAIMVVNFSNSSRILVNDKQTLASFRLKQQQIINQNIKTAQICPLNKPYTQNRQYCFNCIQSSPYFNYTLKQCQSCPPNFVFDSKTVRCIQQYYITLFNNQTTPKMLGYDNYTLSNYKLQLDNYKKSYPYKNCTQNQPFGTISGCKQCQNEMYFDIKKKQCSSVKYLINYPKISPDYLISSDKNLDYYVAEEQKYRKQSTQLTTPCPVEKPYTNDRNSCFNCNTGQYFNLGTKQCQKCPQGNSYSRDSKSCKQLFYITKFTNLTQSKMKGYMNYTLVNYKNDINTLKLSNPYQQCTQTAPFGTVFGCQNCEQPTPYFDIKKKVCSNAKKLINFTAISTNYTLPQGQNITKYQLNQNNYKTYSQSLTVQCPKQTPYTQNRQNCFSCQQPNFLFNFQTKQCQSCPKGSKYLPDKNKCLIITYLTNINTDSQNKMIGTNNYTIQNFKIDQANLKAQNPYENCPVTDPFGTVDGCRKCLAPEEYFNIKNRVCTRVRRLINFNNTLPMLTKQGKTISDYKTDQSNYLLSITQPSITCPIQQPFTSDHDTCFSCLSPQIFNLESKSCQSCPQGQSYDKSTNKCIKRQYYTLFNNITEKNMLINQNSNYTLGQYKIDQGKIKTMTMSEQCTGDKPYATENGCILCNSTNPYFNVELKSCVACPADKKFFVDKHQCLNAVYVTDLTNKNIKLTDNYTIQQAQTDQNASIPFGSVVIKCPSTTPYATLTGCIACSDPKLPLFNIKTKKCQNCRQFYQYFQNNLCKDNIILTNTKKMIGYLQVDSYTRYNLQKLNNITYLNNAHVVDCPPDRPFYNDVQCINCPSDLPIFNLKTKQCVKVDFIRKTNLAAMKYYIEEGDETLASEQIQNNALIAKNVKIQYCPATTPYLSGSVCINCPTNAQYFNLATLQCSSCQPGNICKQGTA